MCRANEKESSSLLGYQSTNPDVSPEKESDYTENAHHGFGRRAVDMAIGFALCALIAMLVVNQHHHSSSSAASQYVHDDAQPSSDPTWMHRPTSLRAQPQEEDTLSSSQEHQYKKFQAMGFQIYTGGAPALLMKQPSDTHHHHSDSDKPMMMPNPECDGLDSYGHFDDYDITNATLPSSLWQCYLGHEDPYQDVQHRLKIMKAAVERAYEEADNKNDDTLKIFIAPEFFFRGREGAYMFDETANGADSKDECTEVCQIMQGLEQLVAQVCLIMFCSIGKSM